jgi:hypothetical protein
VRCSGKPGRSDVAAARVDEATAEPLQESGAGGPRLAKGGLIEGRSTSVAGGRTGKAAALTSWAHRRGSRCDGGSTQASRGRAGRAATAAWTYGRRLGEAPPDGGDGGLLLLGFSPSPPPPPSPPLAWVKWRRWLEVGKTLGGSRVSGHGGPGSYRCGIRAYAAWTAAMLGFRATGTRHASGGCGSGARISGGARAVKDEVERGHGAVALLYHGARAERRGRGERGAGERGGRGMGPSGW